MQSVTSNAVAVANSYSTTEHFTEKYWIDGKKIYRKVSIATLNQQVDTSAYKNTGAPLPSNAETYIRIISTQRTGNAFYYSVSNTTLYIGYKDWNWSICLGLSRYQTGDSIVIE
jgi:hypothetical protein